MRWPTPRPSCCPKVPASWSVPRWKSTVATRRPDANPSTLVPAFDDRALAAASCSLAVDRVPADAAASDPRALGWMRGFPSGGSAFGGGVPMARCRCGPGGLMPDAPARLQPIESKPCQIARVASSRIHDRHHGTSPRPSPPTSPPAPYRSRPPLRFWTRARRFRSSRATARKPPAGWTIPSCACWKIGWPTCASWKIAARR